MITKWEWYRGTPAPGPYHVSADAPFLKRSVRQRHGYLLALFETDGKDIEQDNELAVTLCEVKYKQE